ncbi:hypothetical protein [Azovibrio restrictus]|uniref:hypothetical protein n=1 Tax=Azovibrio restrictus TaxID=146938 RepID=UPI0026EDEA27|nr:hypothetical protein [Azovibrio restrictus]MDD3481540.1 hypothetical protein [Azovibrio restrictus]
MSALLFPVSAALYGLVGSLLVTALPGGPYLLPATLQPMLLVILKGEIYLELPNGSERRFRHSYDQNLRAFRQLGGGQDVATPLLAAPLEPGLKFTLYALWHMASTAAWLYCLRHPAAALLGRFLGLLWIGFGLVFLAVIAAFPEQGLLWQLPQWLLLIPCGLLAQGGLRRRGAP